MAEESSIHTAIYAVQTALCASSHDDPPLSDSAAACRIVGLTAQFRSHIQKTLTAHDADDDNDLPSATYQILIAGGWVVS